MDYEREILILLLFIGVGAVMYTVNAEVATSIYQENYDYLTPEKDLGLTYWVTTRLMLFGLFVSGLSILILCKKLERLNRPL